MRTKILTSAICIVALFSVDLAYGRYPVSPYAYCNNNPVNRVDPDGRDDYFINRDGTMRIAYTDDKFNQYTYISIDKNGNSSNNFIGQFDKNDKGLMQMGNFSYDNGGISFSYNVKEGQENNSYISGNAMASFLGAMATTGFQDVTVIGVSRADGSSPPPSKSHIGGNNMDLRYLQNDRSGQPLDISKTPQSLDVTRQNQMNDALYMFGWGSQLSGPYGPQNTMLKRTTSYPNHTDHLHLQGYKPNIRK